MITKDVVKHIALLARLNLTDQECEKFTSQFTEILTYFEKLNELNTDNVHPTLHSIHIKARLSEDKEDKHLEIDIKEFLKKNAPQTDKEGNFFLIKKVIE